MPELNKQKILAGRKVVEAYRTAHSKLYERGWHKGIPEEHTPLLNIMLGAFKGLGFNSLDEFFGANELLNEQEFMSCYRVVGECDGCVGRKRWCQLPCVGGQVYVDFSTLRLRNVLDWVNSFGEYRKDDPLPKIVYDKNGLSCKGKWVKIKEPDIDWRWQ